MTLAFIDIGAQELILILLILILIISVARYGKNTALGYWGTILLALFASPLIALIVVLILRRRTVKQTDQ